MQLDFQWYTWAMKPPIFIRPLIDDACSQLEAARRTADACRVRRAHIVLASARRRSPKPMAQLVGGAVQTVRHVLHALNRRGVEGVARQSNRPKTVAPVLDAATGDRRQPLLHPSPRLYGRPTGVWTLALAAEVGSAQGRTERLGSAETRRRALKRLQSHGKRAQHWSTSPEPHDVRKKSGGSA